MTMIGFVRHGVTDWNKAGKIQGQTDTLLNEEGRQQARSLARKFKNEQWDMIYSSDLARAFHTAEIMNEHLGLEIIQDARLREVHFGLVEGTTVEERIERWGVNWRDVDVGKEQVESIHARAGALIDDLLLKHRDKRVLLVSHGAFIANSLRFLIPDLDTAERIENASVTTLQLIKGKWECVQYNATDHLN